MEKRLQKMKTKFEEKVKEMRGFVTVIDMNNNPVEVQLLEVVDFEEKKYVAVWVPSDNKNEVNILEVDFTSSETEEHYLEVNDIRILYGVLGIVNKKLFKNYTLTASKTRELICDTFLGESPKGAFLQAIGREYWHRKQLLSSLVESLDETETEYDIVQLHEFALEFKEAQGRGIESQKAFESKYIYEIPILVFEGHEILEGEEALQEELYYILKMRYYAAKRTLLIGTCALSEISVSKWLADLTNQWELMEF